MFAEERGCVGVGGEGAGGGGGSLNVVDRQNKSKTKWRTLPAPRKRKCQQTQDRAKQCVQTFGRLCLFLPVASTTEASFERKGRIT